MRVVGPTLTFDAGSVEAGPNMVIANKVTTIALLPFPGNWYRLCSIPVSNAGQYVEFLFIIPIRHVMLKVTFGKTTMGGNYGSGILKVELLGSYSLGTAHPYKWRVVENGTNNSTFVDIQFPNADGVDSFNCRIVQVISVHNSAPITFPLSSQGSGVGTGTKNYGFSMGSGAGDGWTSQQFTLNATNGAYEALSNTFARTVGTATAY